MDSRLQWTYAGKFRPPTGTSMIYADPSIASYQPYHPFLVYMAYLGTSDARWNVKSAGADEIVMPGNSLSPDQFCVARSIDGGGSFVAPACTSVVPAEEAQLVDETTVAYTLVPGSTTTGLLLPVTETHDIVCPVPANGYWGDYFGLGQYYDRWLQGWWNVAGYSTSDPAGEPDRDCFQRVGWYANPLHVGASTWTSFP